ncbi:MAG: ABC transporter permease subunit [Bacillus subtilis]|nr:ABC transporter permease subunit [Bacillus subtilis]
MMMVSLKKTMIRFRDGAVRILRGLARIFWKRPIRIRHFRSCVFHHPGYHWSARVSIQHGNRRRLTTPTARVSSIRSAPTYGVATCFAKSSQELPMCFRSLFSRRSFSVTIAMVLGMLAGMVGGIFDKAILFITNVFLTIPSLPVFLILAALFTVDNPVTFASILSVFSWAGMCRSIRAQIISLKERDFIQICRVMKMSNAHIIFKELLPNVGSYILINFIIVMKNAITGSVGLMLLGVASFGNRRTGVQS